MLNSWKIGWKLTKNSLSLANKHRHLFVIPACNATLKLILIYFLLHPIMRIEKSVIDATHVDPYLFVIIIVALFIYFMVAHTINFILNGGLIYSINLSLDNKPQPLKNGLRMLGKRLGKFLLWTLFITMVANPVQVIEYWSDHWENNKHVKRYLCSLPLRIAIYFSLPIITFNNKRPIKALQLSGQLVKKTWGEQLSVNFNYGIFFLLLMIIAFAPFVATFFIGKYMMLGLLITVFLLGIINLFFLLVQNIICTLAYRYATGQMVSAQQKALLKYLFITK